MQTIYAIASTFAGPGIGRTASQAALGLWRAGLLSRLVCLGHKRTEIDERIIKDLSFAPRRSLFFLRDTAYFAAKNRWFDYRCQAQLSPKYATLHAWNNQATSSLQQAKKMGIKTVVDRASSHIRTQTELLKEQYAGYGIEHNPTPESVVRRCLRDYETADILVVPSPFAWQSFIDQGFDEDRLIQNPFGVDLDIFFPAEKPPVEFRLIFVGQIGIRKGIPALLEAWDKVRPKGGKLILAGSIEKTAAPVLAKWRNRPDIEFTGFVEDIPGLLRSASAFVFPSCEEGSALVTYEAMASGLPLIVTENSGSLAVDGESAIFVSPGDIGGIADAIAALSDDRGRAAEMGKNARQEVEKFPWSGYGDRTALIHRMLGQGKSTQSIRDAIKAQMQGEK